MDVSALYAKPKIQQPIYEDAPVAVDELPPFKLPRPQPGEQAKPRVLGLRPRVRGRINPFLQISIGVVNFPLYRLPSAATRPDATDMQRRPVLPVVMLADSQVAALRERAAVEKWGDTFYAPDGDDAHDHFDGRMEGTLDELILIADYAEGQDPFAAAGEAMRIADEQRVALGEKKPEAADEIAKQERDIRDLNDKAQRGEEVAENKRNAVKPKMH